jgi:hypothetical protein
METKNSIYRVWRALDADTSYFGIRGRFLLLFVLMAAACLAVTLFIWIAVGDLIGMIFGGCSLIASYFTVQGLQNRFTSREFERMLFRWKCVKHLRLRPLSLKSYIKSNDISWK